MKRLTYQNLFWTVAVLFAIILTSHAQRTPEPYQAKHAEALTAYRAKDFDSAINLYSQAIDLFPKLDAFTPKPRVPEQSEGNLAPLEYRGLDTLYLGQFWAYLGKNETELAQTDLNRSLTVLDLELKREYEKAIILRSSVKIDIEKKIESPNSHNSDLFKAATLFGGFVYKCPSILNRYTYDPKRDFGPTIPEKFLKDYMVVKLLGDIKTTCEAAQFGRAEIYLVSMIELQNRASNFTALQLANELVRDNPHNIEAYRLRSKVNRFLGNEQQAQFDDKKVKDMTIAN